MRVVDQLRDGTRRATELPKRSARGIKSGAKDLGSVPRWVGRSAGNAGRTVGRTLSQLPSRATGAVRQDTSGTPARATGGGDGLIDRARDNPRYAIAIAGGGFLFIAWIAWAVYVTTDYGARAGLGVLLSWPVLLGALILISLPFIGLYLLIRRLSEGGGGASMAGEATADGEEFEEAAEDEDADDADEDGDTDEADDSEDEPDGDEDAGEEADSEESSKAASG